MSTSNTGTAGLQCSQLCNAPCRFKLERILRDFQPLRESGFISALEWDGEHDRVGAGMHSPLTVPCFTCTVTPVLDVVQVLRIAIPVSAINGITGSYGVGLLYTHDVHALQADAARLGVAEVSLVAVFPDDATEPHRLFVLSPQMQTRKGHATVTCNVSAQAAFGPLRMTDA